MIELQAPSTGCPQGDALLTCPGMLATSAFVSRVRLALLCAMAGVLSTPTTGVLTCPTTECHGCASPGRTGANPTLRFGRDTRAWTLRACRAHTLRPRPCIADMPPACRPQALTRSQPRSNGSCYAAQGHTHSSTPMASAQYTAGRTRAPHPSPTAPCHYISRRPTPSRCPQCHRWMKM